MKLNWGWILIMLIAMMVYSRSSAQDVLCNLQVTSQNIDESSDQRIYDALQSSLTEFINNRKWTDYDIKPEERIEFNMVMTIVGRPDKDQFSARLNIVSSRPVYGSAYSSPLLNYLDEDFNFEYVEFQPMDYQDNQYMSNLTSVIAYYVYIIIALDFDSFSLNGGTQFYEKAEAVVNAAQEGGQVGWNSSEDQRNRYWLVEGYLNKSSSEDVRKFYYEYHRLGLDDMAENPDQGRAVALNSLGFLQDAHDARPGLFSLQLVMDAKKDEFVNIFKGGNPQEKSDAQNILKKIDPANSSTYSKISER